MHVNTLDTVRHYTDTLHNSTSCYTGGNLGYARHVKTGYRADWQVDEIAGHCLDAPVYMPAGSVDYAASMGMYCSTVGSFVMRH